MNEFKKVNEGASGVDTVTICLDAFFCLFPSLNHTE